MVRLPNVDSAKRERSLSPSPLKAQGAIKCVSEKTKSIILRWRSRKKYARLYHEMPYFWAIAMRDLTIIVAVSICAGHCVVQVVHRKQLSKIFFRFLFSVKSPFSQSASKSTNPRGEVLSSRWIW